MHMATSSYVADANNRSIRVAMKSTGIISTVAGSGSGGFSGDGDEPSRAQLNRAERCLQAPQ